MDIDIDFIDIDIDRSVQFVRKYMNSFLRFVSFTKQLKFSVGTRPRQPRALLRILISAFSKILSSHLLGLMRTSLFISLMCLQQQEAGLDKAKSYLLHHSRVLT